MTRGFQSILLVFIFSIILMPFLSYVHCGLMNTNYPKPREPKATEEPRKNFMDIVDSERIPTFEETLNAPDLKEMQRNSSPNREMKEEEDRDQIWIKKYGRGATGEHESQRSEKIATNLKIVAGFFIAVILVICVWALISRSRSGRSGGHVYHVPPREGGSYATQEITLGSYSGPEQIGLRPLSQSYAMYCTSTGNGFQVQAHSGFIHIPSTNNGDSNQFDSLSQTQLPKSCDRDVGVDDNVRSKSKRIPGPTC